MDSMCIELSVDMYMYKKSDAELNIDITLKQITYLHTACLLLTNF